MRMIPLKKRHLPVRLFALLLMISFAATALCDGYDVPVEPVPDEATAVRHANMILLSAGLTDETELVDPVPDDLPLYFNPDGGSRYHADMNCPSASRKYLPFAGELTYRELDDPAYAALLPCLVCYAPERSAGGPLACTVTYIEETEDDHGMWEVSYTRDGESLCSILIDETNGLSAGMSLAEE